MSDGEVKAPREVLMLSKVIKAMIEDETGDTVAPLPNVNRVTMEKVLEYMIYHKDHPVPEIAKPLKSNETNVFLKDYPWDEKYIDMQDQAMFFDVVIAANYLDVER